MSTVDFWLILSAIYFARSLPPRTARWIGWACIVCSWIALGYRFVV